MPRDNHPPAMMLYFNDFVSDGAVEAMTAEELGAYFRILAKAWYESPVGTVPDDDVVLSRWARLTDDRWAACRAGVLKCFFKSYDGRFHQRRMKREYKQLLESRRKRKQAGRLGADSRWKKGDSNAIGLPMAKDAISSSSSSSSSYSIPADRKKGRRAGAFASLTEADLADTGRMLAWHREQSAKRKPVVSDSEADRIRVIAAAVVAARGTSPVGLFADTIAHRKWERITQAEEDEAIARLKAFDRAGRAKPMRTSKTYHGSVPHHDGPQTIGVILAGKKP